MPPENKGRYEMLWDCPGCGTDRLLGLTHRHCPNCGAPQDPTRRYFPKEGEEVAVGDHPYQGADVACGGCDTPNAAKSQFCVSCGGPLDGAKAVEQRAAQVATEGGFGEDSAKAAAAEREAERLRAREAAMAGHAARSGAPPPPPKGILGKLLLLLGLGGGLVLIAACAAFFLWKKDASLEVSGHSWERSAQVETLTPTQDSAWRDSVPTGAYDLSCAPAEKSKKKIEDGQDCVDKRRDKGDGSFEVVQDCTTRYREEPVMADKCRYTVDTWKVTDTRKASGGLADALAWPAVTLSRPGTCVGCEREGAKKETYTVTLVDEAAATHRCDLPEARWRSMAQGSRWSTTVGVMSGAVDCEALKGD